MPTLNLNLTLPLPLPLPQSRRLVNTRKLGTGSTAKLHRKLDRSATVSSNSRSTSGSNMWHFWTTIGTAFMAHPMLRVALHMVRSSDLRDSSTLYAYYLLISRYLNPNPNPNPVSTFNPIPTPTSYTISTLTLPLPLQVRPESGLVHGTLQRNHFRPAPHQGAVYTYMRYAYLYMRTFT